MRLALALIFALIFPASSLATAADLDDCIKKSGQEAIRACSDIIERGEKESVQDRARAFYDRGIEYISQRTWDKAISDFPEAIKLNPNETNTLYSRGLTYDNKGDREKAIADYTEVIRIDPKYVNAFGARGLAYEAKGDLRRASDDFRAAIALRADDKVGTDGLQRVGKRLAEVQDRQTQAEMHSRAAPGAQPGPQTGKTQAPRSQVSSSAAPGLAEPSAPQKSRADALAESPRVNLDAPAVYGSIALKGGRIDEVSFKAYRETVDPNSPNIVLLSPAGSPSPYYAEAGFIADPGANLVLPGPDTLWRADHDTLTETSPVTLRSGQ
jgi:tetratricopeptide (TPR) repeat protein